MYYISHVSDPYKTNYKVVINKKNLFFNNNSATKLFSLNKPSVYRRKLNIIDSKIVGTEKIDIYEIPIFYNNNITVNDNIHSWLLSYELNDLLRIMIANDMKFDKNGNIIK